MTMGSGEGFLQRSQHVADTAADIDETLHRHFEVSNIRSDEITLTLRGCRGDCTGPGVSIKPIVVSFIEIRLH
jgi:hypothetical protein